MKPKRILRNTLHLDAQAKLYLWLNRYLRWTSPARFLNQFPQFAEEYQFIHEFWEYYDLAGPETLDTDLWYAIQYTKSPFIYGVKYV